MIDKRVLVMAGVLALASIRGNAEEEPSHGPNVSAHGSMLLDESAKRWFGWQATIVSGGEEAHLVVDASLFHHHQDNVGFLMMGARRVWTESKTIQPFFELMAGGLAAAGRTSDGPSGAVWPVVTAGLGADFRLDDGLALRGEAIAICPLGASVVMPRFSAGLVLTLGPTSPRRAPGL